MKLSLRYFILACIILGAIGVPWAWRIYVVWPEKQRRARRAQLRKELEESLAKARADVRTEGLAAQSRLSQKYAKGSALFEFTWILSRIDRDETPSERRVRELEDQLEKLTGVRPRDPDPLFPDDPPPMVGRDRQIKLLKALRAKRLSDRTVPKPNSN